MGFPPFFETAMLVKALELCGRIDLLSCLIACKPGGRSADRTELPVETGLFNAGDNVAVPVRDTHTVTRRKTHSAPGAFVQAEIMRRCAISTHQVIEHQISKPPKR